MNAPFDVGSETVGDVRVFSVRGELDMNTSPQLREPLLEAIEAGTNAIVIDLSDCEFIDSTGLATLVASWKAMEERNGAQGRGSPC